jgi:predicted site-specific integrase-resolvase
MAKEIRDTYDIAVGTLRQWEEKGLLHPARTAGGHRRYSEKELLAILGPYGPPARRGNRCAVYARVALDGPAGEKALAEQLQMLREEARRRQYVTVAEYGEMASGLDENRKELGRLLRSASGGELDLILVEFKDRLAWGGFKYVDHFCRQHNVVIEEVGASPARQSREELIQEAGRFVEGLCSRLVGKPAPSLAGEVMALLRSALGRTMHV